MRAVFDTNVLLDFWVFDDPAARPLLAALQTGRLQALRCEATEAELIDVLARPRFGLSPPKQQALLVSWRQTAQLVPQLVAAPLGCADPDDQKFLDLAFTAPAQLLVSKDRALLRLARRAHRLGLQIATPAQARFDAGPRAGPSTPCLSLAG